ncbi:MAG: rhomboid family intramembrane serine protease [Pirellulales bacterium]|nr:rhomboid family intramembrane serine protease [Pirellulales bacterium]MBL7194233.1 rhomboid family intramembrane serine protease [Pirellulales bacterium]
MGFQDRGYYRRDEGFAPEWSGVMSIIVANVALWVANLLAAGEFPITSFLALKGDMFSQPWECWQLISYGFAHDTTSPWHLVFNMLALWFFGREVEYVLGRGRFLRFYFSAIVIAGLAWLVSLQVGGGPPAELIGASGGVMAVLAVFIWFYPKQTVLIYGVLPLPAWALGVLYFFSDLQGATNGGGAVAHVAHLGGAIFGLLYAWQGSNFSSLTERFGEQVSSWMGETSAARRGMKIYRENDDRFLDPEEEVSLQAEVDRILEKISRFGEASLTSKERDTLTRESRRIKQRRQ